MPADDSEVTHVLGRLMTGDLDPADMTEEQLVEALRRLHLSRDLLGRTAAELQSRDGWSWPRIGKELDLSPTTAYRWANPRPSTAKGDTAE